MPITRGRQLYDSIHPKSNTSEPKTPTALEVAQLRYRARQGDQRAIDELAQLDEHESKQ